MSGLAIRYSEDWTEHRPAPSLLTDTEILDWLGEHCDQAVWVKATDEHRGGWSLYCDAISERPVKGATLRQAVQRAAALLNEINEQGG